MYLISPSSENYWMKRSVFPIISFGGFWLFSIAIMLESAIFSVKLYKRHRKNTYKLLRMVPAWRFWFLVFFLISALLVHLYVSKHVEFTWRLGLHFLLLSCLVGFVYDTNRRKELWLIKLLMRLKSKDKYRMDVLSIKYAANECTGYLLFLLIMYDVPMMFLFLTDYDKEALLASLVLDSITLLIFVPFFILGHFYSRRFIRVLQKK
jgi:hypothetical protein